MQRNKSFIVKLLHVKKLVLAITFLFMGSLQMSAQANVCDNPSGDTCIDNGGNSRGPITPTDVVQSVTTFSGSSDYYTFTATAGVTYEFNLSHNGQDVELTIQREDGSYRKGYDSGWASASETAHYTAPEDGTYRVRYSIQAFGDCKNLISNGTLTYRIFNTDIIGADKWVGFIYTHGGGSNPADAFNKNNYRGKLYEAENFSKNYSGTNPGPGCNMGNTNFSIRYNMKKTYAAGLYKITINLDDGVRFYIKNGATYENFIDAWNEGWKTSPRVIYRCFDGSEQNLRLEYYQSGGDGYIGFKIEKVTGILEGGETQLCNISGATTTFTTSTTHTGATWHSTNTAVATVSSSGVVTRVGPGITNIQYRSGTCVIASKTVMVNYDLAATTNKIEPNNCTANGSITVNPNRSNFRAAKYWYRNNFNSASAAVGSGTLSGDAVRDAANNNLSLTSAANTKTGTLTINNPGFNQNAVSVNFDMFIGKGSGADGIKLTYNDLVLHIDTYYNGSETCIPINDIGKRRSAISLNNAAGQIVCAGRFDVRDRWSNINLFIDNDGKIIVSLNGVAIINETLPAAYTSANKSTWQWVFSARTGAYNDEHRLDNINIVSYNHYEYSLNSGAWQNSNVFSGLDGGSNIIQIRTQPTAICSSAVSLPAVVLKPHSFVFNVVDGKWDVPTNWLPNGVPSLDQCVTIPTGRTVEVNIDNAKAKNLIIENNANLVISEQKSLIVKEGIITVGNFLVKDKASLIQIDNTYNIGNIKVERISSPMNKYSYTYWGIPVDIKPNQVQWFKQSTLGTGAYNTPTTASAMFVWGDGPGSTEGGQLGWHTNYSEFLPGAGFIARAPNGYPASETAPRYSVKAVFEGKPNNANINRTVVANGGNGSSPYLNSKMTFLGNPYPSAIYINDFLADHQSSAIIPTIYLWGHASNPVLVGNLLMYQGSDFATYTQMGGTKAASDSEVPTGSVASGQGFFVMGTETGGTVTFKNSYRYKSTIDGPLAHSNTQFFRLHANAAQDSEEPMLERHRFWLNLTGENAEYKQTLIGYSNLASDGVDALDGAYYDGGNQTNLYTLIDDYPFVIQAFAMPFEDTDVIPLGFKVATAGTYTISLADFDGLFSSQDIYIKDNLTETEHNLKLGDYAFVTIQGVFEDRFEVIFRDSLNVNTPTELDQNWIVYAKDNLLQIEALGFDFKEIYVYDMLGRAIYAKQNLDSNKHQFEIHSAKQVLIIKVISTDNTTSFKKVQH